MAQSNYTLRRVGRSHLSKRQEIEFDGHKKPQKGHKDRTISVAFFVPFVAVKFTPRAGQKSDRLTLRVAPEENSPVTQMQPTQRPHKQAL